MNPGIDEDSFATLLEMVARFARKCDGDHFFISGARRHITNTGPATMLAPLARTGQAALSGRAAAAA